MIINTLTIENTSLRSMSSCHEHKGVIQGLQRDRMKFQAEIAELQEEISLLKSKMGGLNKSFRLLNNGTEVLDHILEENKKNKSRKGIGLDYKSVNEEGQESKKEFVASEEKEFVQDIEYQTTVKKAKLICHYCGRYGHLRPYCYRLHGYPKAESKATIPKAKQSNQKVRRIKKTESALIAHTSLRVSPKED